MDKMKTMKQWNESKLDFSKFAQPGDEVDEEIYYYFLEVLFPAKILGSAFLVGEPLDHNGQNNAVRYDCFYELPGGKYYYGGPKTVKDFLNTDKPVF
jgi:hypothetical protein